ncbi:MAG: ABC transporter permease [Candidatus Spechtbacteria bacterium]|nr:ABC transporter permease [Candidatus Spechtbacteria bacterium]
MNNFRRIFKYGWLGFSRNIWISTATISIMTLALSVVSGLLLLHNITGTFVRDLEQKIDVSVYLKQETEESKVKELTAALKSRADVMEVEYVSRDQALEIFKNRHKDNELLITSLKELDQNPFQGSLNIKAQKASQFEAIVSFLEGYAGKEIIEKVNYRENETVIKKLTAITSSIQKIGLFFAALLSLVVILVTFNTIRLVIYNYRDEISIMKLVGAGDWFIRGPFIVAGSLYGVFSAILAWVAFFFIVWVISQKTGALFPGTDILAYWSGNFFWTIFLLVSLGVGLGVLSSFIAIRRYLKV